jgi:hypothetical protein
MGTAEHQKARMRRMVAIGSVLAVGVLVLATVGPNRAVAGSNDTMAGAQGPVTLSITGAINTANDVDWYFLYASPQTQLDVALAGLGPESERGCISWTVVLRDADGRGLESTHAYVNQISHIRYTLATGGRYYLEVSGAYCEEPGNYRIDLAASPALLTSPPPVTPPPSGSGSHGTGRGSYAAACGKAQGRVDAITAHLRSANTRRERRRWRAKLRRARSEVRAYC